MEFSRLIFLRHGVRQLNLVEPTPPVSADPRGTLELASESNLNLTGHLLSYKVGKFIRKRFDSPKIIYADVTDGRTIDTATALALGARVNLIHQASQSPDLFFNPLAIVNSAIEKASEELLCKYQPLIKTIRDAIEEANPSLKLSSATSFDPKTNKPLGLVNQEFTLSTLMLFAETSDINDPLLKRKEIIVQIQPIEWLLTHPLLESVASPANYLLRGIVTFLEKYSLSVMVGHHHDLNLMAQFLENPYSVPGYLDYWVPANSGFIFTLQGKRLTLEYLYLDSKNKFQIKPYLTLRCLQGGVKFELVARRVNYAD